MSIVSVSVNAGSIISVSVIVSVTEISLDTCYTAMHRNVSNIKFRFGTILYFARYCISQ